MVIGSILGALLATVFNSHFVNVIYIIIAVLALILMFIKSHHLLVILSLIAYF